MSEKSSPSSELSRLSQNSGAESEYFGTDRKLNVLDSLEAAYAAKPFMDTAVEVFEAAKKQGMDDDSALNYNGLPSLIEYGERKARAAIEISEDEKLVVDVYVAEAEKNNTLANLGENYDEMSTDDIMAASLKAEDQFNQADDRQEKRKWKDLELKLERYAEYLQNSNEIQPGEFSSTSMRAGKLLDEATAETGIINWGESSEEHRHILADAHNLRSETEMLEFIGQNMTLENQKKLVANIDTRSGQKQDKASEKRDIKESLVPDDRSLRSKFIKQYFSEHEDVSDDRNVNVLKDFIVKQARDELDWAKKSGRRVKDTLPLVFRLSAFDNETLDTIQPEIRFTYNLLVSKKPELTFSDFDAMSVEELASEVGIDIREVISDYDSRVQQVQRTKRRFPNIDK